MKMGRPGEERSIVVRGGGGEHEGGYTSDR